jgi:hypothetical protein
MSNEQQALPECYGDPGCSCDDCMRIMGTGAALAHPATWRNMKEDHTLLPEGARRWMAREAHTHLAAVANGAMPDPGIEQMTTWHEMAALGARP